MHQPFEGRTTRLIRVAGVAAAVAGLVVTLSCQPKRPVFRDGWTHTVSPMFPVPLSSVVLSLPVDEAARRWALKMVEHGWELSGEVKKRRSTFWQRSSERTPDRTSIESLWVVFSSLADDKTRVAAFYSYYTVNDDLGYTYAISDDFHYDNEFAAIVRSVRKGE